MPHNDFNEFFKDYKVGDRVVYVNGKDIWPGLIGQEGTVIAVNQTEFGDGYNHDALRIKTDSLIFNTHYVWTCLAHVLPIDENR